MSTLLVNGVRSNLASCGQGIDDSTLDTIDNAVRTAFNNIKHGK